MFELPKSLSSPSGSKVTKINNLIDKKIDLIHTTTIGVIQSFDAETQTAVVQPAIKRLVTTDKQETVVYDYEDYNLLVNVPVVFNGGGGWFMTFPVAQGDECLLFSMERSIGKWKKNGGVQEQSHYTRKLSLKDAVALVGIQSKASSLPNFNASEPELRNREGDIKLSMTEEGLSVTGNLDITGDVTITGELSTDGSVSLAGGNFTVDATVASE